MFCKVIPQAHCLIVERFGRPVRVAGSGLHFFVPFFETAKDVTRGWGSLANKDGIFIELSEQMRDTKARAYFTKDNVQVSVDCLYRWRITDPIKAVYEVDDLHKTLMEVVLAEVRSFVGANELNYLLTSRSAFSDHVATAVADSATKWGITIVSVEVQRLEMDAATKDTMRAQLEASRTGVAMKLAAEGEAEAIRLKAEGEAAALLARANAEKQAAILKAEGDMQATALRAEGEQRYLQLLTETVGVDSAAKILLAQKTFEAYQKIANGNASKVYMETPLMPTLDMIVSKGQAVEKT